MANKKDKITIEDISISNFIFHIVHHDANEPILMDSTPVGIHENFFRERILEIVNGNQFLFNEGSPFLSYLEDIDKNPQRFEDVSRILAQRFHKPSESEEKDGRIKTGAMIFIKAVIEGTSKYVLIKYDSENVLTYHRNGNNAVLEEISNTFIRNKSALQKAAIIDLGETGNEAIAIVTDKSKPTFITGFFKNFLNVKRKYTERDLTEKVRSVFTSTVITFKDSLDNTFLLQADTIFFDQIKKEEEFKAEEFVKETFGTRYKPEMLPVFEKSLKKEGILGEVFRFDKTFPHPQQTKISTAEGVIIQYPNRAADTITIVTNSENILEQQKTVITITTTKINLEHVKSS